MDAVLLAMGKIFQLKKKKIVIDHERVSMSKKFPGNPIFGGGAYHSKSDLPGLYLKRPDRKSRNK